MTNCEQASFAAAGHCQLGKLRLMRRNAASEYLLDTWGIERAPSTLAKLACLGGGPRYRKAGRWPLYDPADLDLWARDLLGEPLRSTSQGA
jgi:hypothetical protein